MATNHTTNYQLNLWEPTDAFLREEFNENTQKIDAALAGKGNCRVITGSYVGTGTAGQSGPTVVTFPAKPLIVFFFYKNGLPMIAVYGTEYSVWVISNGYNRLFYTTWSGNTLSWYLNESHPSADNQMNEAGETYHYIAFCEA